MFVNVWLAGVRIFVEAEFHANLSSLTLIYREKNLQFHSGLAGYGLTSTTDNSAQVCLSALPFPQRNFTTSPSGTVVMVRQVSV